MQLSPVVLTTAAHQAALLDLLDHYARDPMGGGSGLAPAVRTRLIPALAARSDYVGFLAFDADRAVGLINCFEGFSTFAARPLLNVHDIVVLPTHRRRGVGRALLDAAEGVARARGCCKLILEVLSANFAAQQLYRTCGYAPYMLDPTAGQALLLQKWL